MKPHTPNYGYNPYFPPPPPPPPFRRRYNYQRPNYHPNFPPYYNREDNDNVVWSSEWTRWLPASKVNWENLNKRTFIPDIPPSFSGHISNGDVKRFKGLVNKYFSGIFPVALKHRKGEGNK